MQSTSSEGSGDRTATDRAMTNVRLAGAAGLGIMAAPPCDKQRLLMEKNASRDGLGPGEGVLFEQAARGAAILS